MTAERKISLDDINRLPSWAAEMARKYYAGEASHFLLHGNIYDLFLSKGEYIGLRDFLQRELLGNKRVVFYNRSEGIQFGSEEARKDFLGRLRVLDPLAAKSKLEALPADPIRALPMIEGYLFSYSGVGVVLNFVETLIPSADVSYLGNDDRYNLVTLQRWITSSRLLRTDNIVILLAENVSDVNPRIRENSRLVNIPVPYPDRPERLSYLQTLRQTMPELTLEMTDEQLAHMTSGLNRVHVGSMMKSARVGGGALTFDLVREKKKEIIEAECVGLVEFVTPRYGLENVGGMTKAKEFLQNIARTIRDGSTEESPMGILISGPVGTGKTFLAECFAKDCGLNVIEFKNFREKWVGSTESNLEKILNLLETLAPIVVLVDEADATLGNRDSGGDSGVDARIFSKLANAMGNTENRGRILWILMTCRPDLLPIDLKRQGRCEEHISLFYPEGEESRSEIVQAMLRKNMIEYTATDWSPIVKSPLQLSGADIEAILIRSRRLARNSGRKTVTQEDLDAVAREFTPARDETAIEYQTLVAVRESTSREMIPEAYRHLSPVEINRRIEELRMFIV